MVNTTPPGASCVISQLGKPLVIAEPTPAIAIAALLGSEIDITCRRAGFAETSITIPPAPAASMPGFVPNRRPEINYNTRVDITMNPMLSGISP